MECLRQAIAYAYGVDYNATPAVGKDPSIGPRDPNPAFGEAWHRWARMRGLQLWSSRTHAPVALDRG